MRIHPLFIPFIGGLIYLFLSKWARLSKKAIVSLFVGFIVLVFFVYTLDVYFYSGDTFCTNDFDCLPFGEEGGCKNGCYDKENMPGFIFPCIGHCMCLAPEHCICENNQCVHESTQRCVPVCNQNGFAFGFPINQTHCDCYKERKDFRKVPPVILPKYNETFNGTTSKTRTKEDKKEKNTSLIFTMVLPFVFIICLFFTPVLCGYFIKKSTDKTEFYILCLSTTLAIVFLHIHNWVAYQPAVYVALWTFVISSFLSFSEKRDDSYKKVISFGLLWGVFSAFVMFGIEIVMSTPVTLNILLLPAFMATVISKLIFSSSEIGIFLIVPFSIIATVIIHDIKKTRMETAADVQKNGGN